MSERTSHLKVFVERHWPEAPRFFERAQTDLPQPESIGFRALFASVPRRLGGSAETRFGPAPELGASQRPHWTLTDCVRAYLTLSGLEQLPTAAQPGFVLQLFEGGEMGEQVSVLRTLSLLPEPARFVETGFQACRTNAVVVFEAMVCENPFVAEHFPALNFNQAVLKAVFLGVSVARIEGLSARITPELKRMAAGYASERRAAGRSVPADIDYITQYGA
jgi:hypothetical protein